MFTNLLYLIFVMLMISLSPFEEPETSSSVSWLYTSTEAFFWGLGVYGAVLIFIYIQGYLLSRRLRGNKDRLTLLVNLELLIFLFFFHFVAGAPRVFEQWTFIGIPKTATAMFSLLLYFGGIAVFHISAFDPKRHLHAAEPCTRISYAMHELRLLIPFMIPFLFLTFIFDLLKLLPNDYLPANTNVITTMMFFVAITLVTVLIVMIFLPFFIQKIWKCIPLENSPLKDRLEELCRRAHFRQAGLQTWTVLNHSLTAAIIGIVPRFRYVMFTKRLLKEIPGSSVEAILAHEIGHNYRRHLLIYPIIIFGMTVVAGLFFMFTSQTIEESLALADLRYPSAVWGIFTPVAVFVPYAIIIALYFRYVFGLFSRLFERQADLHIFALKVPPQHLINALDYIGASTGNSHRQPNWHHYSIQERIDFLNAAAEDPKRIAKHHRRVKYTLIGYLILLFLALIVLVAPLAPNTPPFQAINRFTVDASNALDDYFNASQSRQQAQAYIKKYHLQGNKFVLEQSIEEGVKYYAETPVPGLLEYYTAAILYQNGEILASATLMAEAWDKFDRRHANPEVLESFNRLTNQILEMLPENRFPEVREGLIHSSKR